MIRSGIHDLDKWIHLFELRNLSKRESKELRPGEVFGTFIMAEQNWSIANKSTDGDQRKEILTWLGNLTSQEEKYDLGIIPIFLKALLGRGNREARQIIALLDNQVIL